MAVSGIGSTTGAELAGTVDPKTTAAAPKAMATIGSNLFEVADSAPPPRPPKSMLARIESFFSGLAAKVSKFVQSFSPFSRTTPSDQMDALSKKLTDMKATSDLVQEMGRNMYARAAELKELKPPSKSDYMKQDRVRPNDGTAAPPRRPASPVMAGPVSVAGGPMTAMRSDAAFPANGVTLEELNKNIDTLRDMMQVNSLDFSGDVISAIVQSPTLMKHLDAFAKAGWRIDIQREANMPKAPDDDAGMLQMFDKSFHLPRELMVRDPVQFLDKFTTGLMLDASKALGQEEWSFAEDRKHTEDLYKIRDEIPQIRNTMR